MPHSLVPVLGPIKTEAVAADRLLVHVETTYAGEQPATVGFVGNPRHGGPVVMILADNTQVFVSEPERFGPFGVAWVRRFFDQEV